MRNIASRRFIQLLLLGVLAWVGFGWSLGMEVRAADVWVTQTLAGSGAAGAEGDGASALRAQLNNPFGVVRGPDRALYFCEYDGQRIRRIAPDGTITTMAGCGRKGAGGDGGPALEAEFNQPHEIRFDRDGHLWVTDMANHRIRRIDAVTRRISTAVGTGEPGFSGDGGPAERAQLRQPHSLQFGPEGDLYVGDIGNHRIRLVNRQTGVITTFAGNGERGPTPDGARFDAVPLHGPRALDFDSEGQLWIALREGNQVFRIDRKAGTIHHVAGTGMKGHTGDGGPAREATLSGPKGIAVARDGAVYLADTESHCLRRIDPKRGIIETVVGTGTKGDGPDGPANRCQLARPHGVFVDDDGTLLIGDSENHRVRSVRRGSGAP